MTSAFLLALQQQTAGGESLISFSDCAVIPQPTTDQLVDIAFLSQQAYESWTQRKPKIAFLSFSTAGSAQHAEVEKVAQASRFFQKNYPAILAEGEVQFDAACDPFIAMRKSPTGQVQGKANVFVFPDLNSGNIAYKIAQRLGGAQAWGPVLLGAIKPFSDLSRGASAQDIAHAAALTLALSSHADAQC
jgi:phosphotransacetylase